MRADGYPGRNIKQELRHTRVPAPTPHFRFFVPAQPLGLPLPACFSVNWRTVIPTAGLLCAGDNVHGSGIPLVVVVYPCPPRTFSERLRRTWHHLQGNTASALGAALVERKDTHEPLRHEAINAEIGRTEGPEEYKGRHLLERVSGSFDSPQRTLKR